MTPPLSLRRRSLLGAAAFGPMLRWSADASAALKLENTAERVRKKLVSLLHDRERAWRAGTVYLRSPLGQQSPPFTLVGAVLAEMGPDAGYEAMRLHIAGRIRRELQHAEVISLDGWILSPTEAWLCGLATLDRP